MYKTLPTKKIKKIGRLQKNNTIPKIIKLKKEKIAESVDPVKKSSIRLWSWIRWSKSPTILESKKAIGNFINLNRKSEINATFTRVPICNNIQL